MTKDPAKRHVMDIPPLYFALAVLLMVALDRWLPLVDLLDPPWSYIGIFPVLAGIGLAVWAERLFARAGTGLRPFTTSTDVVQTGPYQFTRNPMYLGMVFVLFGGFLLSGNLSSLFVVRWSGKFGQVAKV